MGLVLFGLGWHHRSCTPSRPLAIQLYGNWGFLRWDHKLALALLTCSQDLDYRFTQLRLGFVPLRAGLGAVGRRTGVLPVCVYRLDLLFNVKGGLLARL